MRKNLLLLLTILWSFLPSMYAQQRTFSTMKRIAQEKLSGGEVNLLDHRGNLCVYGNDKGFVIVNRQGESKAVIGYSHTKYDQNCLPDGLKWWMSVAERNVQGQSGFVEPSLNRVSFSAVEPFIKSTWNQGKPYNYYCPKEGGDYCLTGCVATALSQVMYYYKYPKQAQGEGSYTLNKKEYTNKITTTYDWDNMKDSYSSTDGQFSSPVKAVAELMRDCGYATDMDYSAESSGAGDYSMALALRYNFKYDSLAIKYFDRSHYSDEEWKGLVYSTLEKKMPVMYAGADNDGQSGHEFLLCGIDSDGLVYVNWGWGGEGDGFFNLDALKYYGNEFNNYQSMVVGTRPQQTPDAQDKFESVLVADDIDYAVVDEDVLEMNMLYIVNYSVLDFNGVIELALENKANKQVTYLSFLDTREDKTGAVQPFYGFYFINDETNEVEPVYMDGFKALDPGIYRMYLTCKEDRDSERILVRNLGGTQYATLKKLSDGTLLVSNNDVEDIDTGIQSVRTTKELTTAKAIYNLKGQRFPASTGSTHKGIYVVNGKKVIK